MVIITILYEVNDMKGKKIFAWLAAAAMAFTTAGSLGAPTVAETASAATSMQVEYLDRGISAISTGSGMLVSWRYLASDSANAEFQLYRGNTLVYTSKAGAATCYLDKSGKSTDSYRVDTIEGGKVVSSSNCGLQSANDYLQLNLSPPGSGYTPNDCSVGDVDGDGVYEIFLKWDPSNSKDNSQKGKTDKVYIDCYKLDGKRLWRIDLGYNIRAGAHYTQFLVADFDLDGKAEMTCKTADGTVDGTGKTIGDGSKTYRNSNGYILTGPEYYTLFDGATGAALDTVDYEPGRGTVKNWGDSYGNRVDRFLGAVAYLDGTRPSAVTVRGYYTRMTATAYDVVNKKLVKRWNFDTGNNSSAAGYGDGNHNCMPADVDGDGKQEIVMGSCCIDDNGKILWNYNKGHGDAMHVGDLDPSRAGIEVWICHEDKPYGVTLLDGKTGKAIFHVDGSSDTGRCCGDNVWAGNDGAELWGLGNNVYDTSGNLLSCRRPAINFLSYWDGDLEREILDGYTDSTAKISKMKADGTLTQLMETTGYYTCNTTKGTPCLSADIFGDWREELIVRAADSKSIRIYCTPYETEYRITTLMHDPQYRNQVAGQNIAYNQPPHPSFYLGSDQKLPARPNVTVPGGSGGGTVVVPPTPTGPVAAELPEGAVFMLKNVNSGLYMEVADASAKAGANVQQWGADGASPHNTWRVESAGDGYYRLYSQLGNKTSFLLDTTGAYAANGTNMGIYTTSSREAAQLYLFEQNADGSYTIYTKASDCKSVVEVADASRNSGANVQQWESNGNACQHWTLERVMDTGTKLDTTKIYSIKNANSDLYLEVINAARENGANVQQWGMNGNACQQWVLNDAGNGYYTIVSNMDDGKTWYLTIQDGKGAAGTNAAIYTEDQTSAQLFKFVPNADGTYHILTKASKDVCGLGVASASKDSGANVLQWTINTSKDQDWILEEVGTVPVETTAPAETTAAPVETTTTEEVVATTMPSVEETTETVTEPMQTETAATEEQTSEVLPETTTVTETVTTAAPIETTEVPVVTTENVVETSTIPPTTTIDSILTTAVNTTESVGTAAPESVLYGDANLDGRVELIDAILLNKACAGAVTLNEEARRNGDCNLSGGIDTFDAVILLRFLVHLESALPVTD